MYGKALFYINGTLVADAEETQVGKKTLVKFRLAWNEKRKDEQIASFITCESWSDYLNENIMKFFKKGKNVHVRGSFIENTYENKEGQKVKSYQFRVDNFDLLDNRRADESEDAPF